MRGLLLVVPLAVLLPLPPGRGADDKSSDTQKVLMAKNFWDKDGTQGGRKWSEAEQAQLAELSRKSEDAVVRLRASKVLIELAGRAKYNVGKDDDAIAVAGFRYLEANLQNPQVKKMLDEGITHYHVSPNTTQGGIWVLIETLGRKPSGGLNLRWDADGKSVVEMVAWGSVK
jgi:hypothetical protein